MLRGILNWWRRRRLNKTRALFEFWDGEELRKIDPLAAWMAIKNHPQFNLVDHYREICEQLSQPETDYMVDAVEKAFGVERWNNRTQRGLTVNEMVDLLSDLINWLNENQKKSPESSPPSQPTDAISSTGQGLEEETTRPMSQQSTESSELSSDEVPSSQMPLGQDCSPCCQ